MKSSEAAVSAEEVYASLHGCAIALLVLCVLHVLSVSGIVGLVAACQILFCSYRPGHVYVYERGGWLRFLLVTTAIISGLSGFVTLLAAVYTKSLMPPIVEACDGCDSEDATDVPTIPFMGSSVNVPFILDSPFAEFERSDGGWGAPATSSPLLSWGRALFSAAVPMTPLVLGGNHISWHGDVPLQQQSVAAAASPAASDAVAAAASLASSDAAAATDAAATAASPGSSDAAPPADASLWEDFSANASRASDAAKERTRRRLKTCVPESGPLMGQQLTRSDCDEVLNGTHVTFSWCIFNALFELGICIFSSIIAHMVGVILSMGRPNGSQPRYDESSSLVGS